jgi:hypothetical protein
MGVRTTTTLHQTRFFETIESFGPGTTYMGLDEITRFKFAGPVTRTERKTVAVTADIESIWDIPPVHTKDTYWEYLLRQPTCNLTREFCESWIAHYFDSAGKDADPNCQLNPLPACGHLRRCDVDPGDEVLLIYWPSATDSSVHEILNGTTQSSSQSSLTITRTAITFHGQDLYYRGRIMGDVTEFPTSASSYVSTSIMYGNFTFVSPTVYVAHHSIRGRISQWKATGPTTTSTVLLRTEGIIALNATDVKTYEPFVFIPSSISVARNGYAKAVAEGRYTFNDTWVNEGPNPWPLRREQFLWPVSMNYSNLKEPVPGSAYFDARYDDCWRHQTHCRTITDGSYRPILALPEKKWISIFPKDFDCRIPLLLDPPLALWPISQDEPPEPDPQLPELPMTVTSQPPMPAETLRPGTVPSLPMQTSFPQDMFGDSPPTTTITSKSTLAALPQTLLNKLGSQDIRPGGPAVTMGSTAISRAPNGDFVVESSRAYTLATANGKSDPAAITVTSRSTLTALAESLVRQLGTRTVAVGGSAVTVGEAVISRAGNGDFIVESTKIYKPAVQTDGPAVQRSGGAKMVSWSWGVLGGICAFSADFLH